MDHIQRHKPLSQREHEELIEKLDLDASDSELEYENENDSNEENEDAKESVSEIEDNLEIESEEDSDQEPEPEDMIPDFDQDSGPQATVSDLNQEPEPQAVVPGLGIPVYTAKSGLEWKTQPFVRIKRRSRNIINARPGLTKYSEKASTHLEFFNLFFTTEMKDLICRFTNDEAARYYNEWNKTYPNKPKKWTLLEADELDCFIGILLKAGALRCRKQSTREMWTTDTSIRRSFFTAAMCRNRFEQISCFLRFDDKPTREERKKLDKMAAISDIWNMFVENCKKAFEPYENITVDEQLVCFRGKCPFRQYIKSKPGRYGIKIWAAADVKTTYLCNLQVYTGKLATGKAEKNQGYRVVSDLTEPYQGSCRGITTDNFFTSVPLGNYLLTKKLTLLGTLRKNKPDTPPQLSKTPRATESSMFAFTDDLTIVSYVPKKNKMVHLLSSQHDDEKVCPESHNKPYIILDYNKTKGAVDNADKLIREYSCARKTARWPFRLFMNMVDIGGLNSFVLNIEKYPDWQKKNCSRRRLFLLQLGDKLAESNMNKRAKNKYLQTYVKRALEDCGIVPENPQNIDELPQVAGKKRARCYQCPRKIDKKVNTKCDTCKKFVCEIHRKREQKFVCVTCYVE